MRWDIAEHPATGSQVTVQESHRGECPGREGAVVYNESAMAGGGILDPAHDRQAWWRKRRLRYNLAVAAAGVLAFLAYATVVLLAPPGTLTPADDLPEVSGFTTAFQAAGYLVAMGVANICYGFGPFAERLFRPREVEAFRRRVFAAGFAFSVALPFAIPLAVLVMVLKVSFRR